MTYAKTLTRSLKRPVVMEGRSLSIELCDYAENIRVYLQASGDGFAPTVPSGAVYSNNRT